MRRLQYYLRRVKGQPAGALILKASKLFLQYIETNIQKITETRRIREINLELFISRIGITLAEQQQVLDNIFLAPLATWPGCDTGEITWQECSNKASFSAASQIADQSLDHHFDVLGSGPVQFSYNQNPGGFEKIVFNCPQKAGAIDAQTGKMVALLNEAILLVASKSGHDYTLVDKIKTGQYQPIDWHLDNKTGFRWEPEKWRGDIKPCSPMGADIKIPRELSRFQHTFSLIAGGDDIHRDTGCEWVLQVLDWICANPLNFGVNWACAMDVSIRMVNWIWGVSLLRSHPALTRAVRLIILKSLYEHACFVEKNLEYSKELTNNHYLANITGLVTAGATLPLFSESDRWLLLGADELVKEMGRTVYPDGVSYEMSTSYHRLVAEMFFHGVASIVGLSDSRRKHLTCLKSSELLSFDNPIVLPAWFYQRLYRMARFTADITKPNGRVPVIGDNDNGRFVKLSPVAAMTEGSGEEEVRDHRHLLAVAADFFQDEKLGKVGRDYSLDGQLLVYGISSEILKAIGAVAGKSEDEALSPDEPSPECSGRNGHIGVISPKSENGAGLHLFSHGGIGVLMNKNAWVCFTGGPNGQNNRGGHNHNDKLSFELNVFGNDLIIDPGLYVYTPLPEMRNYFRSTACHNTLVVPGREQNPFTDFDSQFPSTLFELGDICRCVIKSFDSASISGMHTGYDSEHLREVSLSDNHFLIEDHFVEGGELHFHLAPGLNCISQGQFLKIEGLKSDVLVKTEGIADIRLKSCHISPAYGRKIESIQIQMERQQSWTRVEFEF